jgi:glycerol-3-phosphate dehydrogenase (NAD(P)+)
MKKIVYFGAGTWGFALASLLAQKGHQVVLWTRDRLLAVKLQETRVHPKLPQDAVARWCRSIN